MANKILRMVRNVLLCALVYVYLIPYAHTNETLVPYTKQALAIVYKYCNKNQYFNPLHKYIYFSKLKDDAVGECGVESKSFVIKIDTKFWRDSTEDEKYEVIFHELYHCLFLKDHVDNPNNYMYYKITSLNKDIIINQFTYDVKQICIGVNNGS